VNYWKAVQRTLFVCLIGSATVGYATTSSQVLGKYKNKYFVETSSCNGDGIQKALDAGFAEIYSIELSPMYAEHCRERFKDQPNVHIVEGDSAVVLWDVIKALDAPITFWLDGHYSGSNTVKSAEMAALRLKIHAIKKHPIKTHTILIDDVRDFGTQNMDFMTLNQVIRKIKKVNAGYVISYDEGIMKNDVLVATVR